MGPQSTSHARVRETAASAPEPTATLSASTARTGRFWRAMNVLGKRRIVLVDKRHQLRASLLTVTVVLVLLVLLNMSLHTARQRSAISVLVDAPELRDMIHAQNRLEFGLVILASFVFLAGVFVVTVLETHKTAGAAYNIARHINAVREGRYRTQLRLRKSDNLQAIEGAFNDLARGLRDRATEEAESLEQLASDCDVLEGPDEARALSARIRTLAAQQRRFAD